MPATHSVSRRKFLAGAAGAAGAGAAGLVVAKHPWTWAGTGQPASVAAGKGILVLLTLYGGNDGLNTVIPYQDSAYLAARPTLGYKPAEVLIVGEGLGLHPNLKGVKALWDRHQVAIVRGVGYPNPNRSHFRSMDIWQSGVPDHAEVTGWLGRWLDATGTDPMRALSMGPTLPRALTGLKASGAAVPPGGVKLPASAALQSAYALLEGPGPDRVDLTARVAASGSDLLRVKMSLGDMLAGPHTPSHQGSPNRPAGGAVLATQLGTVAQLINAGAPTRVYQVSLGGFDNHATEKEAHARLMADLDAGISGFMADLAGHPRAKDVVLMTYSEFGRRVAQNASGGTDHGTAAPLFVVGAGVKGGFYGEEPSLTRLDSGDLRFTTDFRSVYTTVFEKVIGVEAKGFLGGPFAGLAFL